jgi:hypothetical protein
MQSRYVFSPKPERRAITPHIVGAILFFLMGAITATALYPNADRHSVGGTVSESRHVAAQALAQEDESDAFSPHDRTEYEYTGGPIPKPTLAAAPPVATTAAKEIQALADESHSPSAANVGRSEPTGNKASHKKENAHRRSGTPSQPYREQPAYGAVQPYWAQWGWGNQFARQGQFATWR